MTVIERLSVLLPVSVFPLPSFSTTTTVPVETLEAEFAYCTTEEGCVVITSAKGLMVNRLLFTEDVMEDTEIRYESPLSNETAYVNVTAPLTAVADWLLLATLPVTREPDVSERTADTDGVALSRLSPSELRRETVMLGLTVLLPDAYWWTAAGCVVTAMDATLMVNASVVAE